MPKVPPNSLVDEVDLTDSSDSEDEGEESVDSIETGAPKEYSGQVKKLIRIYENFAKVMNSLVIFYCSL